MKHNVSNHTHIHVDDNPLYDIAQHFEDIIEFIDSERKYTNVLVHCIAGVSRSATAVIVYLMTTKGWTLKEAKKYVEGCRDIINPNPGFIRQMKEYEGKIQKKRSKSPRRKS